MVISKLVRDLNLGWIRTKTATYLSTSFETGYRRSATYFTLFRNQATMMAGVQRSKASPGKGTRRGCNAMQSKPRRKPWLCPEATSTASLRSSPTTRPQCYGIVVLIRSWTRNRLLGPPRRPSGKHGGVVLLWALQCEEMHEQLDCKCSSRGSIYTRRR